MIEDAVSLLSALCLGRPGKRVKDPVFNVMSSSQLVKGSRIAYVMHHDPLSCAAT